MVDPLFCFHNLTFTVIKTVKIFEKCPKMKNLFNQDKTTKVFHSFMLENQNLDNTEKGFTGVKILLEKYEK